MAYASDSHPRSHHWQITVHCSAWATLIPERWQVNLRAAHWRLYWHDGDGASLMIRGALQPMRARRLYLVPPDAAAVGVATSQVTQWYTHFDLIGLPVHTQRILFDPLIEVPDAPDFAARAAALCNAVRTEQADLAWECHMKALLFSALGETLAAVPSERMTHRLEQSAALQTVMPAIHYIDDHLDAPITLAQLADLCMLTPVYFGRRFHQVTGMTPIEYLHHTRVHAAMNLLAFTDHIIDEIAQRTGFGSRAYFTRIFTRYTSKTPAAFRRALRV